MKPFDRLLAIMTTPWVAVSYVALIVLSILYLDRPIAYFFQGLDLDGLMFCLSWFTQIGLGGLYLGPILLLALFFRYVYRQKTWEANAWFVWLCVLIPSIICLVLKAIFGRARPEMLFNDGVYGFYGLKTHAAFWSFPSGHTSTIMGLMFGLSILLPRYGYALIVLGLSVATSRVVLTHHYLSDILLASYLALAEVGLLNYWLRTKKLLINSDHYVRACKGF